MRLSVLALISALLPAAASAATLDVPLDQAIRLALRTPAHDVIVGNPTILDVEVSDQRHLVLTGKTAGVTNLIIVDEGGRTVLNREVVVSQSSGARVAFIGGTSLATYVCTPGCEMVSGSQPPPPSSGPAPSAPGTMSGTFNVPIPMPAPAASTAPGPSPAQP